MKLCMSDPPKQPFYPMMSATWCLRGWRSPVRASGQGDSSYEGAAGEGSPSCWPSQILSDLLGSPGAQEEISLPSHSLEDSIPGVGSVSAEVFLLPPISQDRFLLHSAPTPPPPLPFLYPVFISVSYFTINFATTCASVGWATGQAARGPRAAAGKKAVTLGGSHLSLPGVWAGGPKAGAPRGEQKLETGSVCGLHDNKGGGALHS